MTLTVRPMTADDVPSYVRIYEASFSTGILNTMWERPFSAERIQKLRDKTLSSFHDPDTRFMVVQDDATGDIIACSKWHWYPKGRTEEQVKMKKINPVVDDGSEDSNVAGQRDFFEWLDWGRDEVVGTNPFAMLGVLITHPNHHRRGAGSMLLKWGAQEADKDGLRTYIEASEMGLPLYERYGYRTVKARTFDLTKYGHEGTDTNTIMIRDVGAGLL